MKIFGEDVEIPKEFESIAKQILTLANTEIANKEKSAAAYTQEISMKKIADLLGVEKEEREKMKVKDAWNQLTNEVQTLKSKITEKTESGDETENKIKELEKQNAALNQKLESEKTNLTKQLTTEGVYNDIISAASMLGLVDSERDATKRDVKELFDIDFNNEKPFFVNIDSETPIMDGDKYANIEKMASIVKEKFPRRFEEIKGGMGGFQTQGAPQQFQQQQLSGGNWSEDMASVHP